MHTPVRRHLIRVLGAVGLVSALVLPAADRSAQQNPPCGSEPSRTSIT